MQSPRWQALRQHLAALFSLPEETRDLYRDTARNSLYTLIGLYALLHIGLTLWGPAELAGRVWALTFAFALVHGLTLWLLPRAYLPAQLLWLGGLGGLTQLAAQLFGRPDLYFLLLLLPLIAVFTLGVRAAALILGALLLGLPRLVPGGYLLPLQVGLLAAFGLAWGLSSNWLSALESASYHYQQARSLLEETRRHQARISQMLKEQRQSNYQLERLNQMLEQARLQAEEARNDRDRFILAVSHELRSPLNFILGFSDLMAQNPETYAPLDAWPPGLYDDVQEIYRSSKHLLALVNDILDLGKMDARRMAIYREKSALRPLVDEVFAMTQDVFAQKGLWLRCEVPADLPPVLMDRIRIRQVLLNLLTNALRFTEQGGVTVGAAVTGDNLRVWVQDTGPGIAPEDLPKVFDVFRQVGESGWRRREGSGLGLAISRRFIELHGGQMDVESRPGAGATFWFTLPLAENDLQPAEFLPARQSVPLQRAGGCVLLLSGDPVVQRTLRGLLDGLDVITLAAPEAVGEAIRQHYPQAVLADYRFPLETLEALPYDLPLVRFMLAGTEPPETAWPGQVRAWLVKPVLRQQLLESIAALEAPIGRVLVIDDDPAMQRFVRQTLQPGCQLEVAASGEEARRKMAAFAPDVILLDMDLAGQSGAEFLQTLETPTPVIVISAADPPIPADGLLQARLTLYLQRGLSPEALQAVLQPLLQQIRPRYPRSE